MQVGLGEVNNREIYSVRVSDNMMVGTPLLVLGEREIISIKYHEPCGDGDKHFVDVDFKSGITKRFFDIISIQFQKEKTE